MRLVEQSGQRGGGKQSRHRARYAHVRMGAAAPQLDPVAVRIEVLDGVQGLAQVEARGGGVVVLERGLDLRAVEGGDEGLAPREVLAVEVFGRAGLILVDPDVGVGDLLDSLFHRLGQARDPEEFRVQLLDGVLGDALV
jgi:hypothetical protein